MPDFRAIRDALFGYMNDRCLQTRASSRVNRWEIIATSLSLIGGPMMLTELNILARSIKKGWTLYFDVFFMAVRGADSPVDDEQRWIIKQLYFGVY